MKMKNFLFLAAMLVVCCLTGCGTEKQEQTQPTSPVAETMETIAEPITIPTEPEDELPMVTVPQETQESTVPAIIPAEKPSNTDMGNSGVSPAPTETQPAPTQPQPTQGSDSDEDELPIIPIG